MNKSSFFDRFPLVLIPQIFRYLIDFDCYLKEEDLFQLALYYSRSHISSQITQYLNSPNSLNPRHAASFRNAVNNTKDFASLKELFSKQKQIIAGNNRYGFFDKIKSFHTHDLTQQEKDTGYTKIIKYWAPA